MGRNTFKRTVIFGAGALLIGFVLISRAGVDGLQYLGTSEEESPTAVIGERSLPLCDGKNRIRVSGEGLAPGERMPEATAREAAALMLEKYRELRQEEGEILLAHGKEHTSRETMIWKTELDRMIDTGYKLFHSPELGTNGVACDMCHPDASNTHPETYPKFQTQLKEVVLLRDMINWCIENPLEGTPLNHDDPKMKALEAYMLSARKGTPMEAGKH
jgi:hypothetical protein